MKHSLNRRDFLKQTSVFTAGIAALASAPALRVSVASPSERVRVAVIGCNGRGMAHIAGYLGVPQAEIVAICDVDSRAVEKGVAAVAKKQARKPEGVTDLRRILDNPNVDAISIAMPEHWHAPATIMGCAAGKHVYVEKPGSHNVWESQMMVAAARRYKRVVQMGNQRRSWPWVIDSIAALHEGIIGEVRFARGWYTNRRPGIGIGKVIPVPDWLDYDLWQGPAPLRPYKDNILHYNWHWFWHWGTGELGNNGVHALDLARWGLKVDLPKRVTCGGNRYFFQDDWETPDTISASFDYGTKGILWEGQSCAPRGFEDASFGVSFFGDNGTLAMAGSETKIYDAKDKLLKTISGKQSDLFQYDTVHFENFVTGVREGKPVRTEIEDGQRSTMLCHLGNIAWRAGETINLDPHTMKLQGASKAARALLKREYRKGWEPKV